LRRRNLALGFSFGAAALLLTGLLLRWTATRLGQPMVHGGAPSMVVFVLAIALVAVLFGYLASLMIAVVDEDARRRYPGIVAGFFEVGAGRFLGRPMAVAWIPACAFGGIASGVTVLNDLLALNVRTPPGTSVGMTEGVNFVLPLAPLTDLLPMSFGVAALALALLLILARLTNPRIAPALTVALFVILELVTSGLKVPTLVQSLVGNALGAVVLLNFGALALAWGIYVAMALGAGLSLLAASSTGYGLDGGVTLALAALPIVLGLLAQRRLRGRGDSLTPRPPATPTRKRPDGASS
jgi:hypothetical protein